ncbi:DUF4358 domain-containing protein [Anaerotignum sp.]|uniref:DUF4358 domain-containing protein n=1 Tax=Anaerotignum sp. TaxID=2039241 RepID=UPI0028A9CD9E|nr:DUF4358 domain-containing protein [Anaerotignum sp.]
MKKNKIIVLGLAAVLAMGIATGCGNSGTTDTGSTDSGTQVSVESGMVSNFHEAIRNAYGDNYLPNTQLDEENFSQKFGVDKANVKNFLAEVPMIGTFVDTLVIIEAEDGKADAVETSLNEYRDALLADTMQYPMNLAKINSSVVYRVDEYVFFIMLGAIDEVNEEESAQLSFAQEEVQKAIDAINEVVNQ